MSRDTLQTRRFNRAVGVCGSVAALARILNVSTEDVSHWLDGETAAPLDVYLAVLRLLMAEESPLEQDRGNG